MYTVGNVRKIFKQLFKSFIYRNQDKFLVINVAESDVIFAKISRNEDKNIEEYNIEYLVHETKAVDDELFYEESLYHFCREYRVENLPVYIFLSENLIWFKEYEFPQMPLKDLFKALTWEVEEFKEEYTYGYAKDFEQKINQDEVQDGIKVNVAFCEKKLLQRWKNIIKEQNLSLAGIIVSDEKCINSEIKLNIADTYLIENTSEDIFELLKNNIASCNSKLAINFLAEEELPKFNWFNLRASLLILIIAVSSVFGSYMAMNYYKMQEQNTIVKEQLDLLEEDIKLMRDLQEIEGEIKIKQDLLKTVLDESSNLYPILLNLGAVTTEGTKLLSVVVDDKELKIKGVATNHQAVMQYKQELAKINFLKDIEIKASEINTENNFVEFLFLVKL